MSMARLIYSLNVLILKYAISITYTLISIEVYILTLKSIINVQLSRDSTPPCVKTSPNNQAFIWDENKKSQFVNSINIEKVEILSDKITSENYINIDETVSEIVNI